MIDHDSEKSSNPAKQPPSRGVSESEIAGGPSTHDSLSSSSQETESGNPRYIAVGFQGPLPSPGMLQEFDLVLPGLARRIVERADSEMQHRHQIEQISLEAQIEDRREIHAQHRRGQWFAFLLALAFGGAGVALILAGHSRAGGAMTTATVVALVTVFVTGRVVNKRSETTPPPEETP